jgi:hypothetical protein
VRRFRLELVRESPAEVGQLVAGYRALLDGRSTAPVLWQKLRSAGAARSGYGVVRGSLRVLA